MKAIVLTATLVTALATAAPAQTLPEQLQKAIYTEETLKNKEEAVRLYRQILSAPTVPAPISTEAQRRLSKLLLDAQPRMAVTEPGPDTLNNRLGGAVSDHYRHTASGIAFDLPPGWSAGYTSESADGGDMVSLTNAEYQINVWIIKEARPLDQVAARVAGAPAEKFQQRRSGYGIPGMRDDRTYEILPPLCDEPPR